MCVNFRGDFILQTRSQKCYINWIYWINNFLSFNHHKRDFKKYFTRIKFRQQAKKSWNFIHLKVYPHIATENTEGPPIKPIVTTIICSDLSNWNAYNGILILYSFISLACACRVRRNWFIFLCKCILLTAKTSLSRRLYHIFWIICVGCSIKFWPISRKWALPIPLESITKSEVFRAYRKRPAA